MRYPDRYASDVLDLVTGPVGSLISVIPNPDTRGERYRGRLLGRFVDDRGLLIAVVIETTFDPAKPVRITIPWGAVESLTVLVSSGSETPA